MISRLRSLLIAMFATVLFSSIVWGTTVIPMTIEQLTAKSTDVVRAEVVASRSEWNAQHTTIWTTTLFRVLSTLKGSAPQEIEVRRPGGSAGGYTMKVAGVRSFQVGETAYLFLQSAGNNQYVVTGLLQGDFRVRSANGGMIADNGVLSGATAQRDDSDVHAFDPQTHQISAFAGSQISVHELEQRVRAAAAQPAGGQQ
jgi:hypothetical protein